jgi:type II secretory pathway component PulF
MFSQLRNYQVEYLLPYRTDASATPDRKAAGYFRHNTVMVGESELAIVGQIRASGGVPVLIRAASSKFRLFNLMNNDYKQQFLTAVYFNCSAMSPAKALEAVIESDSGAVRQQLNACLMIIKRGGGFTEAIQSIDAFDESTLAILEAGERTGTLKEAIRTAVEYLQSNSSNKKLMIGMATFTSIELAFAFVSLVGNRYAMLPSVANNIPETATPEKVEEIQTAIRYAYVINDIMIWGAVALVFATIIGIYAYFDKDQSFRKWVDDKVMLVPLLNKAILHGAVANSFSVAASLVKGGVHLMATMGIAGKSTRVPGVINYWKEATVRSENGDSVAATLAQPMLDNSDRLLVAAHTNRQQLAQSFTVIAQRRHELAKKAAKNFGVVSFLATAMYTALSVCTSLYVLWIQNESLTAGMAG